MPAQSLYPMMRLSWATLLFCCLLSSCTSMLTGTVIKPAIGNLQQQQDITLVCEGAPAYLLMLDSMLVSSPDNRELLTIASQSYSAYTTALEECGGTPPRLDAMAIKAKNYGRHLLSSMGLESKTSELEKKLSGLGVHDVPSTFWGTSGWLTWILRQKGSPEAVADLVVVEKIMNRLKELDESFQGGSIHLFFGAYYSAKPQMFGGRLDLAETHFERALTLSKGRFLLVQTTYAATFARMTMNKELHEKLLNEVISFPLESAPEFALSNQIAVNRARRLLADKYFEE